jgi:hypothetical protein
VFSLLDQVGLYCLQLHLPSTSFACKEMINRCNPSLAHNTTFHLAFGFYLDNIKANAFHCPSVHDPHLNFVCMWFCNLKNEHLSPMTIAFGRRIKHASKATQGNA